MDSIIDLNSLDEIFVYLSAFFGAFLVALWLSLIIWTYRDIRSRSRDRVLQIFSTFIVALLTFPGLAIYLILRPKLTLDDVYQKTLEEESLLTSIELRKVCPGCGAIVKDAWQICAHCHTRLKKSCTHCGQLLELAWQMCPYCANPTPGSPHSVIEPEEEAPEEPQDDPDADQGETQETETDSLESDELEDESTEET